MSVVLLARSGYGNIPKGCSGMNLLFAVNEAHARIALFLSVRCVISQAKREQRGCALALRLVCKPS